MRRTSFIRGSTPTVVLVHGAFADGSAWAGVIAELQAQGIGVVAPALGLRSLAADAANVVVAAERFDGPVVLAGHGYGGAVITVAGARAVNVVALVYVAGFALAEGESCSDVAARFPETLFASSLRPAAYEEEDGGMAVELAVRPDAFASAFAADLPEGTTDVLAVVQRPITVAALDAPAPVAAWRTLPSRYVVAAANRATHPDAQRFMAARAGARTVEVDASDAVAQSCPAAVAGELHAAAVAMRERRAGGP